MDITAENTYAVVAEFDSPSSVYQAAEQVRDAGYTRWDVHTSFPIHGMDAAMGLKRSKVPRWTLVGGLTGFLTGVVMVWYLNGFDYPLIVGGKPFFSPVFPFPIFYELTILFAAFGTFFGMWLMNGLPRPYHSIYNDEKFSKKACEDTFFIVIEKEDPLFDAQKTRQWLSSLGAQSVSLVQS